MRHTAFPLVLLTLAGCSTTLVNEPSLARRAAESIDPRVPVGGATATGPVDAALAALLGKLVADGNEGARSFDAQLGQTEALAKAAGPTQSESWIVAQEALSALEGARAKTTAALADVDALAAGRIKSGAGLNAADLAVIDAASGELRAIADRQSETIDRIGARLR